MLNTSLLVLALALILLPALYAVLSELLSPADRYPEAAYNQRITALMVQQALALPGLLYMVLAPFFMGFSPPHPLGYGFLVTLLWLLQIPLFWLRVVDLRQAVSSINWGGAKRRNRQLQFILRFQVLLAFCQN